MKKSFLFAMFFVSILSLTLFIPSCKKQTTAANGCGVTGGIITPDTYVLWVAQNYGVITVRLFENGQEITLRYNMITVYDAVEPLQSCNTLDKYYADRAQLPLYRGHTYTYTATGTTKTFSGTITVPCQTDDTCYRIQLQ